MALDPMSAVDDREGRPQPSSARHVLTGTMANMAMRVTALVTGPLLARALGPDGRGELAAIMGPISVITIAATIGIPDAATFFVGARRATTSAVMRLSARAIVGSSAIVYIALWWAAPHFLDGERLVWIFRLAALSLPLAMAVEIASGALIGARRFAITNGQTIATAALRLALLLVLAATGVLSVGWAVVVSILAPISTGVAVVAVALRGAQAPRPERRAFFRFGLASWPGALAGLANWRLDQALMVPLAGVRELGFYAVAVALAEAPSALTIAVRSVLLAESLAAASASVIARGSRVTILVIGPVLVGLIALAPWLLTLLFGEEFHPAVGMARVLLVSTIVGAAGVGATSGLVAIGRPGQRSAAQAVAVLVTVAGLLLTVPSLGAMGAAWTTLVATSVSALMKIRAFHRGSGVATKDLLIPRVDDVRWLRMQLVGLLRADPRSSR